MVWLQLLHFHYSHNAAILRRNIHCSVACVALWTWCPCSRACSGSAEATECPKGISILQPPSRFCNIRSNLLQYFILGQLTYALTSGLVKLSVGLLLYRIAAAPVYRHTVMISIIIVVVWSLATVMIIALQCQPLSFAWGGSKTGKCFNPSVLVKTGYAFSAMDIASSWLYSLLPIPMLWNVQMPWKAKIGVMAILAVGIVYDPKFNASSTVAYFSSRSSTATIVRLRGLIVLSSSQDVLCMLYIPPSLNNILSNSVFSPVDIVTTNTWSVVEISVAIFAACIATYRPLLKRLNLHGFGYSSRKAPTKSNTNTGAFDGSGHHELNSLKYNRKMGLHDVTVHGGNDSDSQEFILQENNIQKGTTINVEYTDPQQGNRHQGSFNSVEMR